MEGLAEGLIGGAGREIQRGHGSWNRVRNGWFLIEMG
jgi:hypothetical protein